MHRRATVHRHTTGLTRREALQVGYSGLTGVGLASVLAGRARGARPLRAGGLSRRARSVLIVYLTGAPSHIDTFDPKPDAPAEIRGEFQTIATSAPGVRFCEHLPRIAARAHHLAVVRTMSQETTLGDHERGTH